MICCIKWIFYKKAEGPAIFRRSKNTELTTIAGFVSSRQSHKTTTRQEVELFRYMYTSQWKSVDKSVFSTFPDKLRLFEIDVTMTYVSPLCEQPIDVITRNRREHKHIITSIYMHMYCVSIHRKHAMPID